MPFLVYDLETSHAPWMPPYKADKPDAFEPPPYHQIEIVGLLWLDWAGEDLVARKLACLPGESEAELVAKFVRIAADEKVTCVSFGGRNFDMPVMTAATMRAGVPFPARFRRMSKRWGSDHVDVSDALGDFGACRSAGGLEAWSLSLGWPGKLDGIHGGDVATMIATGRRDAAEAYCMGDCCMLAGVFLRLLHARNTLSSAAYVRAVESLISLIEKEPRLGLWSTRIDRERVLRVAPEPEPKVAAGPAEPANDQPKPEAAA